MSKKKEELDEDLSDVDEDELLDDIPDDILLNEDLDDPLFAEAEALLGKVKTPSKTEPPNKSTINTQSSINSKKSPIVKQGDKLSSKKAVINNQTMKEFSLFLLKKSKSFEEISFHTILRKIPKEWNFSEDILIDVIEALIENNLISSFSMKMTANSLKFYMSENLKDKKHD